jgi:AraC-like DNA-binding protein
MSNVIGTFGISSSHESSVCVNHRNGSAGEDAGQSAVGPMNVVSGTCRIRKRPTQREAGRRIEGSLVHMWRHLNEPLRVSTLSALSGLSVSLYSSLFKCATGYAPIQFFIRLRMQRACELLRETTLSIKEIATLLGYGDPFYFSRIFKSVNRVAPSYYRLQITEPRQGDHMGTPLHPEKEMAEDFLSLQVPVWKQFRNGALNGEATDKHNGNSSSVSKAISNRQPNLRRK